MFNSAGSSCLTKAVYRIEQLDANPNKDTYFQILNTPNYVHHVVGLRYDLDDSNALMFQVKQVVDQSLQAVYAVQSQSNNFVNLFWLAFF